MNLDLDYGLWLNVAFAAIIAIGMLIGFLRGFRNSLYSFLVKLSFFVVFFLTLNAVVNMLWTMNIPGIGSLFQMITPAAASATSFADGLPLVIVDMAGEDMSAVTENAEVMAFASSIGMFVLKIVYTILAFTVLYFLWRVLFFIVKLFVFRLLGKGEKTMLSRSLGAGFGALNAGVSVFVMLIMLGGLMSISESLINIVDDTESAHTITEFEQYSDNGDPAVVSELQSELQMLRDIVNGYNSNLFVQAAGAIVIVDEQTGHQEALNVSLFDSIFSINYRNRDISLRKELSLAAEVVGIVIDSDFLDENDLSKLTPAVVDDIFDAIARSDLITALLPLSIEVAAIQAEFDLQSFLDDEGIDLYEDIPWDDEIRQLGTVAGIVARIVHDAQLLDDDTDLETVTLDDEDIKSFFYELAESEVITMALYVAVEPILEQAGEMVQAIVTVPAVEDREEDFWKQEFRAVGDIVAEVVKTGITVGQLSGGDPMDLLGALGDFDFLVFQESVLISHAMVNILEGRAEIEGLDMIVVPAGLDWFDKDEGELRKVLLAIGEIAKVASQIDFEGELGLNLINELETSSVDVVVSSEVLEATLGNLLMGEDIPEQIKIPRNVLKTITTIKDETIDIVKGSELTSMFDAIKAFELADLDEFDDIGISFLRRLATDEDPTILDEGPGSRIDRLLGDDASVIIWATLSDLFFDLMDEQDAVTVPHLAVDGTTAVQVYDPDIDPDLRLIARAEIISVVRAILLLDLEDFEDLDSLDIGRILEGDNIDTILLSSILHATISKQLFDFADAEDAVVVVPHYRYVEDDDDELIRETVGAGQTFAEGSGKDFVADMAFTYIVKSEIRAMLDALTILELTDLDAFEDVTFNIGLLVEEEGITPVLDSAILHATVSKLLLDMADDTDDIIVPLNDVDGEPIRQLAGENEVDPDTGDDLSTVVLSRAELQAVINALHIVLGDDVLDDFDGNITLSTIYETDENDPDIILVDERDTLLASAILHATISKQIFNLIEDNDDIVVPLNDVNDLPIREPVPDVDGTFEYIIKDEIKAMIAALDVIIGGAGLDEFDGDISLDLIYKTDDNDPDIVLVDRRDTLLASAILHATISKQILNLVEDNDDIVVPLNDVNDLPIRESVAGDTFEYIIADEIKAMIAAMNVIFAEGSLTEFDGDISLDLIYKTDENDPDIVLVDRRDTLLESAILHATISKQILNLVEDNDDIVVPLNDAANEPIREPVAGNTFEYIIADEIKAMIAAMNVIFPEGSLTDFDGDISLDLIYKTDESDPDVVVVDRRDTLLESAILHATISKQILNLVEDNDDIIVPLNDVTGASIRDEVDDVDATKFEYITADEIKNMIAAMNVIFPEGSLTDFDGDISLELIYKTDEADSSIVLVDRRDTLLASAILHATISHQILDLDTTQPDIVVPYFNYDRDPIRITVADTVGDFEYLDADEIKAMIAALDIVFGDGSLTDFDGDITLSVIYNPDDGVDHRGTLLASAVMHATISQQIIDLDAEADIVVPYHMNDGSRTQIRFDAMLTDVDTGLDHAYVYIASAEIENIIAALHVLIDEGESFNDFAGNIALSTIYDPDSGVDERGTLLASAILHATISKQIIDLDADVDIVVPFHNIAEEQIRFETTILDVDTNDPRDFVYLDTTEIENIIAALNVLIDEGESFDDFAGNIALSTIYNPDTGVDERGTLLASALLHATISKQIIDLDAEADIVVPFHNVAKDQVRFETTILDVDTNDPRDFIYLDSTEIENIIAALNVLIDEGESFDGFAGDIALSTIYDPDTGVDERSTLLASALLHATISKQIIDLETTQPDVVVPYHDVDEVQVRFETTVDDTITGAPRDFAYMTASEIEAIIAALVELVGEGQSFGDFDGNITIADFVEEEGETTLLLDSALLHATISAQIIDLETTHSDDIVVPFHDFTKLQIRFESTIEDTETSDMRTWRYISKDEVQAAINALAVIVGAEDGFNDFDGYFNLSLIYNPAEGIDERATLLNSAIIQASISKQVIALDDDVNIVVPYHDFEEVLIRLEYSIEDIYHIGTFRETNFVLGDELKAVIAAMTELVDEGESFDNFTGDFDLSQFVEEEGHTTLLDSAIIHATMSMQIIKLEDDNPGDVIVPFFTVDNEEVRFETTVNDTETGLDRDYIYMHKDEVQSLINALALLVPEGESFASFTGDISITAIYDPDPLEPVDNRETLLASTIIHATLSNTMIEGTGDVLVVRNYYDDTIADSDPDNLVRIEVDSVIFIANAEIDEVIKVLADMGLTDFADIDITPANLLSLDFAQIISDSAIMHATISKVFLDIAGDEHVLAAPGAFELIVPLTFREGIDVGDTTGTQIEDTELIKLLEGFQVLDANGVIADDFGDTFDGAAITNMSDEDIDQMLSSASLHVTIVNMLLGNPNIDVPLLATDGWATTATLYGIDDYDVITVEETKNFIVAAFTFGEISGSSVSFTDVEFNFDDIMEADEAQRNAILDSMIVQKTLYKFLEDEGTFTALAFAGYTPDDEDYHFDKTEPLAEFMDREGLINTYDAIQTFLP